MNPNLPGNTSRLSFNGSTMQPLACLAAIARENPSNRRHVGPPLCTGFPADRTRRRAQPIARRDGGSMLRGNIISQSDGLRDDIL
jgi:hypothetical protein